MAAQPVWITPAGSLGVIPEGIYYQETLRAQTPTLDTQPLCTATSASTNSITCASTTGIYAGLNVTFTGVTFGSISEYVRYFVFEVIDATHFSICETEFSTTPIALTTATGTMIALFTEHVLYSVIAGSLPEGIQVGDNGSIVGVPLAVASLQGVPQTVSQDIVSKFTIRAYTTTLPMRIKDRTFTITVTGNDVPKFTTPSGSLGTFYDGDELSIQIGYTDVDPDDTVTVKLVAGELPGGVVITPSGLITGYIRPATNVTETPGYDQTPIYTLPYDFIISAISRNYQFTLEVTDGKSDSSDLRTFEIFVYDRGTLTADDTSITADSAEVTADETTERRPFLINATPSNLGTVRGDNYYAHQFVGNDYDTPDIKYAIAVNEGSGLPPGLTLDPVSGFYYGYVPDQGITEVEYSFNVTVYQSDFANASIPIISTQAGTNYITGVGSGSLTAGQPLSFSQSFGGLVGGTAYTVASVISNNPITNRVVFTLTSAVLTTASVTASASLLTQCTATTFGTNRITCNSTSQIATGQPIVFTGTAFGGITASPTLVYYVLQVINATQFTVTTNLSSSTAETLTNGSGTMYANLIVASDPYPFTLTISGAVDAEVTWLTAANLGTVENGDTSLLKVEASNRGGRELFYRLKSGAYNQLPQGLELLPSGEISGRVSFNTFAVDLGSTTFDNNSTTWDSSFTFTVNAYAEDTNQIVYDVASVTVLDGGTGYSSVTLPVIDFNTPVGASAQQAQVGNVTVAGGAITTVDVADPGAGYSSTATVVVTEGFGGSGAVLQAVMRETGIKDVVSVFKTFTVRVIREYNQPYQNLIVQAMPPLNDRELVTSLLDNTTIFVPEYIFRPDDPYFGKATRVNYDHAFGLAPDALDQYVASLYENHYWKNLVLGEIATAQAVDPVTGEVVYEVVYSKIIDNLVNNDGESVNKIVNLAYPIVDPGDGSTQLTQVYPNSLVNMRNQVIDVVGQISTKLPLWMTSKQADGRVLGFTPAWVMCYTQPNRSKQIAYYIQTQFGEQLNRVDFKVDRYILDRELSRNWDATTQDWVPQPSLTTFDRFNTGGKTFIGTVDIATDLAYSDINNRTLAYINALGGFDGVISSVNNDTIIFVKQEDYDGPPGSSYGTANDAWQQYLYPYDSASINATPGSFDFNTFDNATTIPNGTAIVCTQTFASNNRIQCNTTSLLRVGQEISFTDEIGGIVEGQIYYVMEINAATQFRVTATAGSSTPVTLSNAAGTMVGNPADERMAIYTIAVDPVTELVTLTLTTQTAENEFVQVVRGSFYRSAQLYYPTSPGTALTEISWLPLVTVTTAETTFDEDSMQFIEPVDMYDPTDQYDKYLVFPKANILV